jgi:hypothetical protein
MKIATGFTTRVSRACLHTEDMDFAFSSPRTRAEQELRVNRTLCGACRLQLQELVATIASTPCQQEAMWLARLPVLYGEPAQISWAHKIRARVGAFYFPLLEHAGASTEMPLSGVRASLRLLFSISNSAFWITNRDTLNNQAWLVHEVETLSRNSNSLCAPIPNSSAYGYWNKYRPDYIESAKKSLNRSPASKAA